MASPEQVSQGKELSFIRETFSDMELAEFKESFNAIDGDQDGCLSKPELIKMYNLNGINPTEEEIDALIASVDLNKNGKIDFNEYLLLMKKSLEGDVSEFDKMVMAFQVFDRNMDGYITKDEFKMALCFNNELLTDEEFDDFFCEIDTDCDGKINYREFIANSFCQKAFG